MPISPNLHASWYLCEDITSEPPLGLNHIPMHRRARICSCSGYNLCAHQPIKTESRILTSNSSSSKKKKEVLARHDCSSSRPAAPLLNARLMQNRGRSTVEARAARATLNNAGRVKSKECVLSSSPQDVDRGREKPFPVGGHRAELAGALFGGRKFSLIYSPMSGFTS